MRIRFVSSTPMQVLQGSGTYVAIRTLAKALHDLGTAVEFVTPPFSLPVYTLQRLVFNRLLRFRRDGVPHDVTVGFDMDGYTIAGRGSGIHVASIKGVIADEMRFESGLTRAMLGIQASREREHVRRSDFVITTSTYSADKIQSLYEIDKRPSVIPELIDLELWNGLGTLPAPSPSTKFTILTVCRFYPRKRVSLLLGAVERLRSRIPAIELRIVGGGPEESQLRAICRRRGIENLVVWRRDLSLNELSSEYRTCDVFCLPSVQEGFGIVFLEAMAHAKPIVAARAGAVPEVVKHGLLVEPDDEEGLAAAIEKLYREPALRASLGEAGFVSVHAFDALPVARAFLREVEGFRDASRQQLPPPG